MASIECHGIPYGLFLFHIFPSRLRTFSEAPALFTMYTSEGPISKTNKPPDRTASNNEDGRGVVRYFPSSFEIPPVIVSYLPSGMLPREPNPAAGLLA